MRASLVVQGLLAILLGLIYAVVFTFLFGLGAGSIGALAILYGIIVLVFAFDGGAEEKTGKKQREGRPMENSSSTTTRAWGVASLVLGIASLLFVWLPFLGVVFAVLAIVFYGVQRRHGSTGLATAGLVTGIIGIVLNAVILIFFIGVLALVGLVNEESRATTVYTPPAVAGANASGQEAAAPARVRSPTIEIDRAYESLANLQPLRVTIHNTGEVMIRPNFDIVVTDAGGQVVCQGSPFLDFTVVNPGQRKTTELAILGCMFGSDGDYTVHVTMMDENYEELSTAQASLAVRFYSQFMW